MKGFIYIIKNTVNTKVYIGQTKVSIDIRWKEHLRHANTGDQLINKAMRKYGVDKFYIECLEICNIEDIDSREMYYIDLYDSVDKSKGYNVSIGGLTPRFKRKELDIQTLIFLYEDQQFSTNKIAKKFGVSVYIINSTLKDAGVKIRDRHDSASRFDKISKDVLIDAMRSYASIRKAAKSIGVPYSTFRKACIYNHVEYNFSKSVRHLK